MTVKEVAEQLGVSHQLIYQLVSARQIRFSRIGLGRGRIFITAEAVQEFIAAREVGPIRPTSPARPARITLSHLQMPS